MLAYLTKASMHTSLVISEQIVLHSPHVFSLISRKYLMVVSLNDYSRNNDYLVNERVRLGAFFCQ